MRLQAGLLGLCALTAACGGPPDSATIARHLNERLDLRLAPEIASGQAVLEPLPDGARVTLPEAALFPTGGAELDDKGRYVVTNVIQGMMDPKLMQLDIAAGRDAQGDAVGQFFAEYLMATPPAVAQFTPAPGLQGVAITIRAATP